MSDPTPPSDLLDDYRVPNAGNLFVIGSFDQRVTFYSQQIRALNLVDAMVRAKVVGKDGKLLIIGAGLAGLTAAAAAAKLGVQVRVLEKQVDLLPTFRGCHQRFIHPRIYDWPEPGWNDRQARLPVLDWTAASAANVAEQVITAFEALKANVGEGSLRVTCNALNIRITQHGAKHYRTVWSPSGTYESDAVVLAVGFGVEPDSTTFPPVNRYWDDNDYISYKENAQTWFVSGCGDGGLTDVLRLRLKDFRHEKIFDELFRDLPELGLVEERLRAIEREPISADRFRLTEEYGKLRTPELDRRLLQRLRSDRIVILNATAPGALSRKASILNRFLVSRFLDPEDSRLAIQYFDGESTFTKDPSLPHGAVVKIAGHDDEIRADRVIIRRGPEKALEKSFAQIYRGARDHLTAAGRAERARQRAWEEGRFGPEVPAGEAATRTNLSELEGERGPSPTRATPHVDVGRLLHYAPAHLIGREEDMGVLVDTWAQASAAILGRPRIVSFVALGGEGKTALVAKWLTDLASADWPGASAVFAWSFYTQGAKDWSAASSDLFLREALTFFGDPGIANSSKHAVEKAKRLVHLLRERRALLVLDGLEPLQYPPSSPMRGRLKDQAMAMLLKGLAAQSPGLCVLTTRYAVAELEGAGSNVQNHPIKRLSTAAGVALLKALGVQGRVGELQAAVEDVRGHALTLNLLGRYLRDAYAGDVRRRDQVQFEEADAEEQGGHAFRVMDQYMAWFETDEAGRQAIALLRLMGLFDRPAAVPVFASLLAEPSIAGLTESVVGVSEARCNVALARLEAAQLLTVEREDQTPVSYDAHPLVREYFARRLQETRGVAWRAGHRRLFEHLRTSVEHRPATLEGLQPLYQAVVHGCLGGLHQVACTEVYIDRILRGTSLSGESFYSLKNLGAFGTDLGAVAFFFDLPWRQPSATLRPAVQAWLIGQATTSLCALGRLQEALEPRRAQLEIHVSREDWKSAVAAASNLVELTLALGEVDDALAAAEQAALYAQRSRDTLRQTRMRANLAYAQHQAGRPDAVAGFRAAEAIQAKEQPSYPLLYGMPGYAYCDLLLAPLERAVWRRMMGVKMKVNRAAMATCHEVRTRAQKALRLGERTPGPAWPFDLALNRLCLGRAAIYRVVLDSAVPNQTVRAHLDAAVENLRRAGQQDYLPRGLLSRALLRAVDGHLTGHDSAQEDLDEAWDIAEQGPMRLHLADVHLHRARLFASAAPYPWDSPEADLRAARVLIERCGYGRRLEELADAEAHLRTPP